MKHNKDKIIKKAVALSYKKEYNAPKVIAKGKGRIAEKIVERGSKEGIEIYRDEKLIEDLINLIYMKKSLKNYMKLFQK